MHNSYYLIRQVVKQLELRLKDTYLAECFSQHKDELIIRFINSKTEEFNILAHLDSKFTCLAFPSEYHKARRNTATLFKPLIDQSVTSIEGFENERAFIIHFEDKRSLLFKLFGNQANILLIEGGQITEIFKNNLNRDFGLKVDELNKPIEQNAAAILANRNNLRKVFPALDKQLLVRIEQQLQDAGTESTYAIVTAFIRQLEAPDKFYLVDDRGKIRLSFFPEEKIIATYTDPLPALTRFFQEYMRQHSYQDQQQQAIKELEQTIKKTAAYIKKTLDKKNKLISGTSYQQTADILMANLHAIPAHSDKVTLINFYTNDEVTIKLNPKLSAQKNAEKYYQKAKNLENEVARLNELVKARQAQSAVLMQKLTRVKAAASLKELQAITGKKKAATTPDQLPFKKFVIDGFTVLVGKNAKNNDLLTLKYAHKDDLFFHAKDVSGSHVILKQQSGKQVPAYVLEKTASLAAWYSKRKTDSLCPVGYTPKKYVRKPKGSPAGLVLVEREKVLLVKPELPG